MSRTKVLSIVVLMVGAILLFVGISLGYPILSICLSSDPELVTWQPMYESSRCFDSANMVASFNPKSYILFVSFIGVLIGSMCVFVAWASARQKLFSRRLLLVVSGLTLVYFVLLRPLPRIVPNVVVGLVLFAVLLAGYLLLRRGANNSLASNAAEPHTLG
jgi:hypothetical protein